ncbi:MAG: hypothetical protein QOJ92_1777 [Frankiales bacterium]|nr:hypothetical protein [Frankiales bacterium]
MATETPQGKGRPTPKRSEKVKRRVPVKAPQTRKEAYALARANAKDRRNKVKTAYSSGDDRILPPRDRGPVKSYVRDYVDVRRNAGTLFLPGAVVILICYLLGGAIKAVALLGTLLWAAMIAAIILDSSTLARSIKLAVRERYPNEPTKGIGRYGVLRALQIRKFRLPPPRVKRGDPI